MSALLSSTFWLLLNTPMVPPEHDLKARRNVVPMVELGATASSHKRRRSVCYPRRLDSPHSLIAPLVHAEIEG